MLTGHLRGALHWSRSFTTRLHCMWQRSCVIQRVENDPVNDTQTHRKGGGRSPSLCVSQWVVQGYDRRLMDSRGNGDAGWSIRAHREYHVTEVFPHLRPGLSLIEFASAARYMNADGCSIIYDLSWRGAVAPGADIHLTDRALLSGSRAVNHGRRFSSLSASSLNRSVTCSRYDGMRLQDKDDWSICGGVAARWIALSDDIYIDDPLSKMIVSEERNLTAGDRQAPGYLC